MPEPRTDGAEAAPAPPLVWVPIFDEKGALVGWDRVADRADLAPKFAKKPSTPADGSQRWNAESGAFEAVPKPKRWLPRFDAEGGLIGFTETTADKVPPGALAFDRLPDNACDARYRWDDNLRRFEPRPHVVARVGDTAAVNKMVVSGIIGLVPRETLPIGIQDQIRFIEETSPETVRQLKKRYAALTRNAKLGAA